MSFFDFLKGANIDRGVSKFNATPGAVLLDVRTPQEYRESHIHGSKNVPPQTIGQVAAVIAEKNTPIFVYCYSGARSGWAVTKLRRMGYTNVTNIGGISAYSGKVER